MATSKELDLKTSLYDLLMLKEDNKDLKIVGLDRLITRTKSAMTAEDVAYVEAQIDGLKNQSI